MSENMFKIKGVGCYKNNPNIFINDEKISFFHTNLSDVLDNWQLGEVREHQKVIISTDFLDRIEPCIEYRLEELSVKSAEILFVDSECDFKKYSGNLKALVDSGLCGQVGIKNPKNVTRIKEILEDLGKVNYISLNVCPLCFNYDVISWCEENGVEIFGYNPFGNKLTEGSMINSFSVPYLLGFAANYCSVVVLSGDSGSGTDFTDYVDYLYELIGRETSPKYVLKKNINKLTKPLKKTIYTSLTVDGLEIPYEDSYAIHNPEDIVISLNKPEFPQLPTEDDAEPIVKEVYDVFNQLSKPEDGSDSDFMPIINRRVFDVVKKYYPENKDRIVLFNPINNTTVIYKIITYITNKKGWFKYDVTTEEKYYVMAYSEGKFLFKKLF